MLITQLLFLMQATAGPESRPPADTTQFMRERIAAAQLEVALDTLRQRRPKATEVSELYGTRNTIHRVLSYALIPLFLGSAYTGFQLRSKGDAAPKWVHDLHGPLAGGTAVVFGMNTLTGVWNLIEGRHDPVNRTKRLVHGALFLLADAGFVYVIAKGDNITSSGKPNHWHRDVALASMTISLASWSMMALFK